MIEKSGYAILAPAPYGRQEWMVGRRMRDFEKLSLNHLALFRSPQEAIERASDIQGTIGRLDIQIAQSMEEEQEFQSGPDLVLVNRHGETFVRYEFITVDPKPDWRKERVYDVGVPLEYNSWRGTGDLEGLERLQYEAERQLVEPWRRGRLRFTPC